MKFTIEETGWVNDKETQEQTLSGDTPDAIPEDICGLGKKQINEVLDNLMFGSFDDCKNSCSEIDSGLNGYDKNINPIQRKITITVKIEDLK